MKQSMGNGPLSTIDATSNTDVRPAQKHFASRVAKWLAIGCTASALALSPGSAGSIAADAPVNAKRMQGASMVEAAAAPYIRFRKDIADVAQSVAASPEALRNAHQLIASHDSGALSASWIAYAAMIAADTKGFAAEIERQVKAKGAAAFVAELEGNPGLVRNMRGADDAIAAILTFAARDAAAVRQVGDAFIDKAYDLQKVAWARKAIAQSGMKRVDSAISFAENRKWAAMPSRQLIRSNAGTLRPNLADDQVWKVSWSTNRAKPSAAVRPGTIVTKALVLGAHYATNTVTDAHMNTYASSRKSERCFSSAKMNLDQCIAATSTPFEEAFCLGQHGLNDNASCVGWPAGATSSDS